MILNHMAPSSLNMSSYRAIRTHFRSNSMIFINWIFKNFISKLQISGKMDAQPSGRRKTWCQETLCHLSQSTGGYLASWSCRCSAALRNGGGGCLSTALHRHNQLTKYHPVPWLRWHNVSWHQVFRLPEGWTSIGPAIWSSDIFDTSSTSGYVGENSFRNLVPDFVTCSQLVGT